MQVEQQHLHCKYGNEGHNKSHVRGQAEPILRTKPLIDRNEHPCPYEAKDIERIETRIIAKTDVMDDLREKDQIAEDDHPLIIAEEVDEGEVEEQSKI